MRLVSLINLLSLLRHSNCGGVTFCSFFERGGFASNDSLDFLGGLLASAWLGLVSPLTI